jgi:putative endonuclease
LDLVVQTGETVVFVEVKTRRRCALGAPEEAITPRKIGRLVRSAQLFLAQHDLDVDWRVDVIAIEMDRAGGVCRFNHLEDATRGW